ncbi:hypothetical protein V7S43_013642 [Phytophthora oleae]|uniref:DUF6818 domain-containing protein n=1 Tax=Phytophthora oleae TaxID=2107226 RepID=A0ABD3F589_9STRA
MVAKRGRQAGYCNYSAQEQLLLYSTISTVMPIGRNMWEQTARLYNAQRKTSWMD